MTFKSGFFVTGIDTNVGKTWATLALMQYFKQQGFTVVGMKPVASGCQRHNGQLKNTDALLLQANSSVHLEYTKINPYAFKLPISPHLASKKTTVRLDVISQTFDYLLTQADLVIVEGAGGWLSPVSDSHDIADIANILQLPVIMVVAIRLGCINQARLTYAAIQNSNSICKGWLAVRIDPKIAKAKATINTIKNQVSAPLLGVLPCITKLDIITLSMCLNFSISGDILPASKK